MPKPGTIEIHTTDRNVWRQCRQKWDFQSNIRYNQEPVRPVDALWIGSGFHVGIGEYYNPEHKKRSLERAQQAFNEYVDLFLLEQDEVTDEMQDWANEHRALGLSMLNNYVGYVTDKGNEDHDDFEVLWVEREFHVPMLEDDGSPMLGPDGAEVIYSFRVDALVVDKHGRLWILEHKTAAQFWSNTEWLLMDPQPGSYLWGLHQVLEPEILGRKIEGVIYTWVKKKEPKPLKLNKPTKTEPIVYSVDKSQDTTPAIVKATLTESFGPYAKWDTKYKDFYQFVKGKENNFVRREPVRRNQKELEFLGQSLRFEIWEMINDPPIYRNPTALNCSMCPFVGPCLARWEGGDYEGMLLKSGLFRERENQYALAKGRE